MTRENADIEWPYVGPLPTNDIKQQLYNVCSVDTVKFVPLNGPASTVAETTYFCMPVQKMTDTNDDAVKKISKTTLD